VGICPRLSAGTWSPERRIPGQQAARSSFSVSVSATWRDPGNHVSAISGCLQGIERQSCLGGSCLACGACTDDERSFLASHQFNLVSDRDMRGIEAVVESKRHASVIFAQAELPANAATAAPAYAATLFAASCMRAFQPQPTSSGPAMTCSFSQRMDASGSKHTVRLGIAIVSGRPTRRTALEAAGYAVLRGPSVGSNGWNFRSRSRVRISSSSAPWFPGS